MKRTIKSIAMLVAITTLMVSCEKDKNYAETLADLKSVVFPEQSDEVLSSEFVRVVTQGTTNKKEVLQTVKAQKTLAPVELIDGTGLDVIYPGSVLSGESFMDGRYNNLVIKNPKEITLSFTLQGTGLPVSTKALPVLSNVRQKVNDLVYQYQEKVDHNTVPSYLTYISNEVSTLESFNKTFGIHAKISVWGERIKSNFSFEESKLTVNSKKYVLIKVRQMFYNVSVDPILANEWGNIQNVGSYEPVYISSVDYGRVAHLLVETEQSSYEVSKKIQAGISASFSVVKADVKTAITNEMKEYFEKNNIRIMVAGGPLSAGKLVTDYVSFMEFLKIPESIDLVNS